MTHKIIFETDDIVLHYNEGQSDFLLVTFVGAFEEHDALNSYFCQPVCEENHISCIGVTTKQRNWYHGANMEKALEIIQSHAKKFSKIISFGPSAGGYAAIKYSKILNAATTIAFAPLVIVEREEKWQTMAIKPEHLFGEIFIFFDPREVRDIATATAIKNTAEQQKKVIVKLVHVDHAGHVLLNSLKGRKNLLSFISTAESSELSTVEKQKIFEKNIRIFMRYSLGKLYHKIHSGYFRHPYLTYRMLKSKDLEKIANYKEVFHDPAPYYILINRLQAIGYTKEARALLKTIMTYQLSGELNFSPKNLTNSKNDEKIMLDHRGGVVSYSTGNQHFTSDDPVRLTRSAHTVFLKKIKDKEYPFISCLKNEFFFSKTETGIVLTQKPGNIFIEYLDTQCCMRAEDGTYLAISNGLDHFWSDAANAWERFSPVTLPCA